MRSTKGLVAKHDTISKIKRSKGVKQEMNKYTNGELSLEHLNTRIVENK